MMDKNFDHKKLEPEIYKNWEEKGHFHPDRDPLKKPYTIVLPPPNGSGKMHIGNVLMIAIEDLLIRWKRMEGRAALWLPGTDHAGFETQVTYERELKKQDKSRFDFDRQTLYQDIHNFVMNNRGLIHDQIRSMGASVDWERYTFTLDEKVIDTVMKTFEKMHTEGLIYRDNYMVNYCPRCGTTFADLEVKYIERKDPLYYMKYGPFVLATVRPETKFGDTAVAVNPNDERYKQYIGQEIEVEGLNGPFKLKVIADDYVDMEFGTGVVKITPAHDKNDYEVGKRHNLEIKPVIGLDGKMTDKAGKYAGLFITKAREEVVKDLQEKGLIDHIDENYSHSVAVCYKAEHDIEPMVLPNWFVKVETLKKPALDVVLEKKVKIYPKWRESTYTRWMEEMHDWPISRQLVWGIRIPAWYNVIENPDLLVVFLPKSEGDSNPRASIKGTIAELLQKYSFEEIEAGIQSIIAPQTAKFVISRTKPEGQYLQDTDTFDTWFSSGHWPLVTLGFPDSEDFKYFYPTSVLETGWEIIRLWVSRMIMFGIYHTGEAPFKEVYLHGLVRAIDGRKMSKSLGNVINPDEYLEKYGADVLRMGLVSGTANGKDFAFPQDKIIGYRNFSNKIWNMGKFLLIMMEKYEKDVPFFDEDFVVHNEEKFRQEDKDLLDKLKVTVKTVTESLEKYRFADASDAIYHFMWDDLASSYIEHVKNRDDQEIALAILRHAYLVSIKLLHPFMPFVTEEIWKHIPKSETGPLIVQKWPEFEDIMASE